MHSYICPDEEPHPLRYSTLHMVTQQRVLSHIQRTANTETAVTRKNLHSAYRTYTQIKQIRDEFNRARITPLDIVPYLIYRGTRVVLFIFLLNAM